MLHVDLGTRGYDIAISSDDPSGIGAFARERCRGTKAVVIADENAKSHAESVATALNRTDFAPILMTISPGEASKCLAVVARLYDVLAGIAADRQTLIAAVGGGVIGDVVGFVAATYNRGLPLLHVPTSLVAMVDSSIGGKVGINHAKGKNLIGAFYQPIGVWIDTAFLVTLPDREYRSGLAEVVKYGVILEKSLFAWLERNADALMRRDPAALRHIITRSGELKARIVEIDEREETGERMVLNYGHTFAHAFELVGGYSTWLHGEAVAAGMICASRLAERLGLIKHDVTHRQVELLERFGLPTAPLPEWSNDTIIEAMRRDKKSENGRLRFVLPVDVGQVVVRDDVDESTIFASPGHEDHSGK